MRGDRTPVYVAPQIRGIIAMLEAVHPGQDQPFPIGQWYRPQDADKRFKQAPYVMVRVYPSADQMTGSLDDTQTDTIIRVQLLATGRTANEALEVSDWTRTFMQRARLEPYLAAENRAVMDLRLMVSAGGLTRDDDLPTPMYLSQDLYELRTTRLTRIPES